MLSYSKLMLTSEYGALLRTILTGREQPPKGIVIELGTFMTTR